MPEPGKKKRTRKSTAKTGAMSKTNGAHPGRSSPSAEAPFVEHAEAPVGPLWEAPDHELGPGESDEVGSTIPHDGLAAIYYERGLERLLHDNEFINQLVDAMTQSKVLETLVEDVADKLKDALESNPEFRRRLVSAVVCTEVFKRKMARVTR